MAESLKNCPACNSVLRPNAVFCHHCGRSLTNADSQAIETQNLLAERVSADTSVVVAETPTIIKTITPSAETSEKSKANNQTASKTEVTVTEFANSESETAAATNTVQATKVAAPPRTKQYVNQTEYLWTETTAPAWRIILFSLLAFALVILLLWLNNFLR